MMEREKFFEETIVPALRYVVENELHLQADENGRYSLMREYVPPLRFTCMSIQEILLEDDPTVSLREKVWGWEKERNKKLPLNLSSLYSYIPIRYRPDFLNFEVEISAWLMENVVVSTDIGKFFSKQKMLVNLTIAMPGGAADDFQLCKDGMKEDSALSWLCEQMGKKEEVQNALAARDGKDCGLTEWVQGLNRDPFVGSVVEELIASRWKKSRLTFLLKLNVLELIGLHEQIRSNRGSLLIDSAGLRPVCGLFTPTKMNDYGRMGIVLDKDLEIPVGMVWDIEFRDADEHGTRYIPRSRYRPVLKGWG